MAFDPEGLTPEYLRAARALLNWSAQELADRAEIGVASVRRAETVEGFLKTTMKPETKERMVRTLENAGVVFLVKDRTGGWGVRRRR